MSGRRDPAGSFALGGLLYALAMVSGALIWIVAFDQARLAARRLVTRRRSTPHAAASANWTAPVAAVDARAAAAPVPRARVSPALLAPAPSPKCVRAAGRARKLATYAFSGAMALLWVVALRPTWLGGSATYIVVRGDSMLPTHDNGDLIFLQAQVDYMVGDVVGYRVPQGELGAGQIVVHRIIGIEPDGSYTIKGDNNPTPDPWHPRVGDVAGRAVASVPALGRVIAMVMSPTIAGGMAAALVVMALMARTPTARRPHPQNAAS